LALVFIEFICIYFGMIIFINCFPVQRGYGFKIAGKGRSTKLF